MLEIENESARERVTATPTVTSIHPSANHTHVNCMRTNQVGDDMVIHFKV